MIDKFNITSRGAPRAYSCILESYDGVSAEFRFYPLHSECTPSRIRSYPERVASLFTKLRFFQRMSKTERFALAGLRFFVSLIARARAQNTDWRLLERAPVEKGFSPFNKPKCFSKTADGSKRAVTSS